MSNPRLDLIEGSSEAARQAATWFTRLRADDASEQDRQQWKDWMERDPAHRQAYSALEVLWSELGDFAPTPEIAGRVRQARQRPARNAWRSPRRWIAAAASLLVAVLVGRTLLQERPVAGTTYATAKGERRSVQLEDGSRVDLDSGATLHVRYDRRERRLLLERGRAFFRVAHGDRPLRVETAVGSVVAVGTQFEVDLAGAAIEVALFEGKVDLLAQAADQRPAQRLASLDAGQSARVSGGSVRPLGPVQAGGAPAWLSGRLVFDDLPLSRAVAEFNRYSARPLELESAALDHHRISGSFRSDDTGGFVEALEAVYGIDHRVAPDGAIILAEARP